MSTLHLAPVLHLPFATVQLITRKVVLFLKVTDPVKLNDAMTGILAGAVLSSSTLSDFEEDEERACEHLQPPAPN